MPVHFFHEDTNFRLTNGHTAGWIETIVQRHGKSSGPLNFIFTSDAQLLDINKTYLDHDYYTDVLAFSMSEEPGTIEGDIFISINRVRDNAANYGAAFEEELHRVMAHGVLHLLGLDDKTPAGQQQMRKAEDHYLQEWKALRS